jgi:hypothetical protein
MMHLANYLGLLHKAELHLADGFRQVGDAHAAEPDVYHLSHTLADQCQRHAERLQPFVDRYGEDAPSEPDRLHSELFRGTHRSPIGSRCSLTCSSPATSRRSEAIEPGGQGAQWSPPDHGP